MFTKKSAKIRKEFVCINCLYNTCDKKDYNKHINTAKHKFNTNVDIVLTNIGEKSANLNTNLNTNINEVVCNCGKKYKSRQGLYAHKKKCAFIENGKLVDNSNNSNTTNNSNNSNNPNNSNNLNNSNNSNNSNNQLTLTNDLIIKLLNDNKEMREIIIKQQDQISELLPKIGNNFITNNNNNNKFNIQVFLNERCKDAINMSDFIKSIQVSLQQLDYTKQNGIVNGLSNVIIENMNKLGLYQRPIHCTDIKRESLYIKDDDNWEKDINKEKIRKAIKDVSTKQFCALSKWTKENPDFQNNESKQNYYTHTLVAIANNKEDNEEKIIKKLCNNSYIKED
jgi:hypothetical protein